MSLLFGGARQNGFIVEDLDAALQHWVHDIGVGPFFVLRHLKLERFVHHGQETSPDLSIALGFLGDLELELVQQHNDAPSPYLHYRQHKGAGLQHMSSWTRSYDDTMSSLRGRGLMPDTEGTIAGGTRFCYFGADALDGSCHEIADLGADNEFGVVHDMVRAAAQDWDGTDPIRETPQS